MLLNIPNNKSRVQTINTRCKEIMNLIVAFLLAVSKAELFLPYDQNSPIMFDFFLNPYQTFQNFINIKILKKQSSNENVDDWANQIAKSIQISNRPVHLETIL